MFVMVIPVGAGRTETMASERTEAAGPTTVWPQRWQRSGGEISPAPDLRRVLALLRIPYPWTIVIALTFLAGLLRLVGIGEEAFWKNELFSVYWVRNPFDFLLTRGLISETNPPLLFRSPETVDLPVRDERNRRAVPLRRRLNGRHSARIYAWHRAGRNDRRRAYRCNAAGALAGAAFLRP